MIGDNAKRSIIDNSRDKKWQKRACININSEPLEFGHSPSNDSDYCMTSGAYTLKYKPIPDSDQFADKPYVIKCDLFAGNKIRFSSYRHLEYKAQTDKKIKWIVENTTLTPKLLGIAKRHPAMPVPFCLDLEAYCERLGRSNDISRFLWEVEEHGDIERVD